MNLSTTIGKLRFIGYFEGISLLILFFVAMPIKYILHNPAWVQVVGLIHGLLFILYVLFARQAGIEQNWEFKKTTLKLMVASILPFGTFYTDVKILKPLEA